MTDAPSWFNEALSDRPEAHTVSVEGTDIHYVSWGTIGKPGLVFVHGGAAHAEWWSFIAPFFSTNWHAVALDLSGHGESGWRKAYGHATWAKEVMAVISDADFPGPPVVVGHSLGGRVTIQTASTYGDQLAGAVIVDAPVTRPSPEEDEGASGRAFRSPGVYPTLAEAMTHFRLIPPQPCDNGYIIEHIARHSLHKTPAGWTWKFDPHLFRGNVVSLRDQLATAACRIALFTGEHSAIVPPDVAEYMYDLMGHVSPVIEIPLSYHHLMLDQPLAFVAAIRTLLTDWNHSTPFARSDSST